MKTIKKIGLTAFTALALVLSSCSSDDGGSGGGGGSLDTYINAKVDGVAFKTLSVQGHSLASALKTGSGATTLISITASSAEAVTSTDVKTINITLMGISTTGTYTINSDSESVISYVESAMQKSWDTSNCEGATCTLEVTALTDTKIEGTFTFTGKDDENCSSQKVVTAGKFRGTFVNN